MSDGSTCEVSERAVGFLDRTAEFLESDKHVFHKFQAFLIELFWLHSFWQDLLASEDALRDFSFLTFAYSIA